MHGLRIPLALVAALATTGVACGQASIEVMPATVLNLVGFGAGGALPAVIPQAASPSGLTTDGLQPASYIEWRVPCNTPGLYTIGISLAQWSDPACVLAFETRPFTSPDAPYATRYGTPDTRDYGETNGAWAYANLGDVEDAAGNTLTVPLWAGDNVFRIQNVSGRHNPAYQYPPNLADTHDRDWDFYWSNAEVGRITLTRVSDLPAFGQVSGTVSGDRPHGIAVRKAIVTANPPASAPMEPSSFWRQGYFTYSRDDGTYSLTVPSGENDIKAGRPGSYQVQGSPIATVTVPAAGAASADLQLASIFHDDGHGHQVAEVQLAYFDQVSGSVSLLSVDGENGYKLGWVDPGESCSVYVDVPRTGNYTVATSYFNGGTGGGVVRISAGAFSTQATQPRTDWPVQGIQQFSQPLYLVQGTNLITHTLVSGTSDMNSFHLTMPDVTATDATRALSIAAGLLAATPSDQWMGTLAGDSSICHEDAVRILQAAMGNPL
ncbi:MAG TPA: hypothetical protein VGM51_05815 [Armatimonadota bacterium]|jgi:hypothetical protein